MNFDWSDYLDFAQTLVASKATYPSQEAALRTAISRAYYSAFCKSRNYLRDIDNIQNSRTAEIHKLVQETLKNSENKNRKKIGTNLERLRRIRNKADYEDNFSDLQQQATLALKWAKEINTDLNKL